MTHDWNSTNSPRAPPRPWNERPTPKHWDNLPEKERARLVRLLTLVMRGTK